MRENHTVLQDLTDHVCKHFEKNDKKIDGSTLYDALKVCLVQSVSNHDTDQRVLQSLTAQETVGLFESEQCELKSGLAELMLKLADVEINDNYAMTDSNDHRYFVRRASATIITVRVPNA